MLLECVVEGGLQPKRGWNFMQWAWRGIGPAWRCKAALTLHICGGRPEVSDSSSLVSGLKASGAKTRVGNASSSRRRQHWQQQQQQRMGGTEGRIIMWSLRRFFQRPLMHVCIYIYTSYSKAGDVIWGTGSPTLAAAPNVAVACGYGAHSGGEPLLSPAAVAAPHLTYFNVALLSTAWPTHEQRENRPLH